MRQVAVLACLLAGPAIAAPPPEPQVEAALIAEAPGVAPGGSVRVGLRLKAEPGWHTYWRNPGDAGTPTEITWSLPPGATAGPIEWPVPQVIREDDIVVFGYAGEVVLPSTIRVPAEAKPGTALAIRARAYWVVCKDICIPGEAELATTVLVALSPAPASAPWPAAPVPRAGWAGHLSFAPGEVILTLTTGSDTLRDASFLPHASGRILPGGEQRLRATPGQAVLRLPRAPEMRQDPERLDGVLLATVEGQPQAFAVVIDATR